MSTLRSPHPVHVPSMNWSALGAQVEEVDPGFDDPLEITVGLWFLGAWTLWNTLSSAQQARTDVDFSAQAALGASYSALDIQRLNLRRGALGAHMRQFMQRYDLLVTPTVAVPAFEARPAGHSPMTPTNMLGWTPFSYPFNLTQQPALHDSLRSEQRRPAARIADSRPDVRRRPRATRGACL